jgi:hypothetical protein
LKKKLKQFMKGDDNQIDAFVFKIVSANHHCYAASRRLTTGAKLADAVRRVAMCYKQEWKESPESAPEEVEIIEDAAQEQPRSSSHLVAEAQAAWQRSKTMWGPLFPQRASPGSILVPDSPVFSSASPKAHEEERQALHYMLPHHPTP